MPGYHGRERCPFRIQQLVRIGEHCLPDVRIHRPLAKRVGGMRHVHQPRLMLGNEVIVRDYVRQKVACIADCNRPFFVAGRGEETAHGRPPVATTERRGSERKADERKIGQARAREDEARKTQGRTPEVRVRQRQYEEYMLRKEDMRVQTPCRGVAGEEQ